MSPMRGPLPSYRPEFPSTFLKQAEKIVRHRIVKYQLRQRATLVLLLDQQPLLSNVEAAERVRLHLRSVQRWRHRWAQGDFSLDDEPGRVPAGCGYCFGTSPNPSERGQSAGPQH